MASQAHKTLQAGSPSSSLNHGTGAGRDCLPATGVHQRPHGFLRRRDLPKSITVNRFELGRRLRAARAYEGIGRPELGERLGVSESLVAQWERGHRLPQSPEDRLVLIQTSCTATEAPQTFFID